VTALFALLHTEDSLKGDNDGNDHLDLSYQKIRTGSSEGAGFLSGGSNRVPKGTGERETGSDLSKCADAG